MSLKKFLKNLFTFLCLLIVSLIIALVFIALLDRAIQIETQMQREQAVEAMKLTWQCYR